MNFFTADRKAIARALDPIYLSLANFIPVSINAGWILYYLIWYTLLLII